MSAGPGGVLMSVRPRCAGADGRPRRTALGGAAPERGRGPDRAGRRSVRPFDVRRGRREEMAANVVVNRRAGVRGGRDGFPAGRGALGAPRRDPLFAGHRGGAGVQEGDDGEPPRRVRLPHSARGESEDPGSAVGLERLPEPGAGGERLAARDGGGGARACACGAARGGTARCRRKELQGDHGDLRRAGPREDVLPPTVGSRNISSATGSGWTGSSGVWPGFPACTSTATPTAGSLSTTASGNRAQPPSGSQRRSRSPPPPGGRRVTSRCTIWRR